MAIITFDSTTINLENYKAEVIPDWRQPKVIHQSVLTQEKFIYFKDDLKKGEFQARIRVFNSDSTIDSIKSKSTVNFNLYGTAGREVEMIVKDFKPFYSGNRFNMRNSCSILLESKTLITNPISY